MVKIYTILNILTVVASVTGFVIPEKKDIVNEVEKRDAQNTPFPDKHIILAPINPPWSKHEVERKEVIEKRHVEEVENNAENINNKLEKRTLCDNLYEPAFYADAVEVVNRFKGYGAMKCRMGPNGCSQMFHHKSAGLAWCAEEGAIVYCKDIGEAAEHILVHCTNGDLTGGFNEMVIAGKSYGVRIVKTGALNEKKHHH